MQVGYNSIPNATRDFKVDGGDFSCLEIRPSGTNSAFYYFYDTAQRSLVVNFMLEKRARVTTLCEVTLIKKGAMFTPRLRLWKRDGTRGAAQPFSEEVPLTEATKLIKASVDTKSCHRAFWTLINYLNSLGQVENPGEPFHLIATGSSQLAEALNGQDKDAVFAAVRSFLGHSLTDADIELLANRKGQLNLFKRLLEDEAFFEAKRNDPSFFGAKPEGWSMRKREAVWQQFFEENTWIFGYGLTLVACDALAAGKLERITTGASVFSGGGKRADAVMKTRGLISSLLFCEIKTHRTPLLAAAPYREPDVYRPSNDLVGGLSQLQKTSDKAVRPLDRYINTLRDNSGRSTGIDYSAIRPRQVLVIGSLGQLIDDLDDQRSEPNDEMLSAFELFRRAIPEIEILTFDELYMRACFIVKN